MAALITLAAFDTGHVRGALSETQSVSEPRGEEPWSMVVWQWDGSNLRLPSAASGRRSFHTRRIAQRCTPTTTIERSPACGIPPLVTGDSRSERVMGHQPRCSVIARPYSRQVGRAGVAVRRGQEELEAAIRSHVSPSFTETVRAKMAIREIVADCEPHGIRELQRCLIEREGLPEPANRARLDVTSAEAIGGVVHPEQPIIAAYRLALAAAEAVQDLVSQGVLVPVAEPPRYEDANPIVGGEAIRIPYQFGSVGTSVAIRSRLGHFAPAYHIAPRFEGQEWFFEPDIFTADLETLALDRRTRRCILEALAAYRQGLHLATASLLGAASEGAWYAAGEKLRHLDNQLDKALDEDRTAKVVNRVAELLRRVPPRGEADELVSQASLMRQLRNYGVHPRGNETDYLERYFNESGAGLLLLETYSYLQRLDAAVERTLGTIGAE